MDPIARMVAAGAAGAAGGDATYVDDVFSTYVYVGNGGTQTITNDIDLSGEGGLVWIKNRSNTTGVSHVLFDTERGASTGTSDTQNKALASNINSAEGIGSLIAGISSFNSDGFTLDGSQVNPFNANGPSTEDYVSWTFRKAPGFFDVVTYTGNGTAGRTIAHNLGSVPGFIVVKNTSSAANWRCYHRSLGANKHISLDRDTAASTNYQTWNDTAPTSTVFTVGSGTDTNANGENYVAYVFAHDDARFGTNSDESIIKCGSYTGNGSESGNVIDLGFEPQWLMIKRASNSDPWLIWDIMRGMTNEVTPGTTGAQDPYLRPNTDNAEDVFAGVDVLSTGFELASSTGFQNSSGETYIYMAIRRPHKPPTAGTDVFAVDLDSASSTIPTWDSGFPVDMAFYFDTLGGGGLPRNSARLLGSKYLIMSDTNSEASDGSLVWDSNEGWGKDYDVNRAYYSHMFRRAPGFFDVVAYNGTGTARTIPHNLGAVPQMIIVKRRNGSPHWQHWYYSLGAGGLIQSAGTAGAAATTRPHWNNTLPTATHFSVGTDNDVNNSSGTYIAYLFGSLNGISKVGSYSGTGSDVDVNCGFSNGARFVMIKRSDAGGDFYIWDSLRGITSGNDPYFLFNSTAAQVTNTDYIDPLSSGFTVTSNAPDALNVSGGTYLFLAIA